MGDLSVKSNFHDLCLVEVPASSHKKKGRLCEDSGPISSLTLEGCGTKTYDRRLKCLKYISTFRASMRERSWSPIQKLCSHPEDIVANLNVKLVFFPLVPPCWQVISCMLHLDVQVRLSQMQGTCRSANLGAATSCHAYSFTSDFPSGTSASRCAQPLSIHTNLNNSITNLFSHGWISRHGLVDTEMMGRQLD